MRRQLWHKFKESLVSVLPVTLIVIILSFTPLLSLSSKELWVFIFSAVLLIVGISLFNLGADMSMQPMGEHVGSSLVKTKKLKLITLVCFMMGLLITIAEPDLSVLADQVSQVIEPMVLIVSIGVGVGVFLVLAILKIVFKKDLSMFLMYFYLALFAVAAMLIMNGNGEFLALSFDSGGVTTGPITVPFIMALGVGVASTIGGRNANENSFGLISLCSVGPILVVLILGLTINPDVLDKVAHEMGNGIAADYQIPSNFIGYFYETIWHTAQEVLLALGLIVLFFLVIQFIYIKLPKYKLIQIFMGIMYTFIGLVFFLTAATVGFLPIGFKLGEELAQNEAALIIFGFILGMVVVLAEPAVHVLTKQVEEITTGGVSKRTMLLALSIGVGISICLAMIRIVFDFSILWIIIPGYMLSLGLSFFVPKIYTAIAFDSGGVASGPLTSSFILPLAVGACSVFLAWDPVNYSTIMENGFGIVAMVAMTPLITIQILGFKDIMGKKVTEKKRMKQIIDADDEQIINFM
ncbi:MAG: DUF1538 domain-containing protein [Acholeplasmatales bacterium]|nr:DUF1538 domain-containing protein [Acholeplasmatales bacterium]